MTYFLLGCVLGWIFAKTHTREQREKSRKQRLAEQIDKAVINVPR